jgi:predicted porin
MNKLLLTAALALALVPNAHGQAAASTPPPSPFGDLKVSGDFDYESQYVFRGKKITNSAFQPSVDFTKTVSDGTLKAYVWTSQPIGRAGNPSSTFGSTTVGPNQNNEIDIGAYYDHSIPGVDSLTGELGYQMYWYPDLGGVNAASRSHEFHIGAIYDTTSVLNKINISPTVMLYHDVILDSNTITGAISYSWDLSDSVAKGLSLNPTFTLGWTGAHRVFGDITGPNWNNSYSFWELDLELDYALSSNTTLYVAGHYAGNDDGTTNGLGGGNPNAPGSQNQLWLGLGVKWNM